MRSPLLVIAAALLVGAAPAQKLLTPRDIVAAAPASAWKDDSRRRPAGHRSRWRRPGGDPARARLRAGPRRQYQGAGPGRLLERRHGLSGPGQLCRAMGPQRQRQAVAGRGDRQAAGGIYAAAQGAGDQAARLSRPLCAGGRFRRRLAGRIQSQGGLGRPCPLLWQRRRRPRPCARHGHAAASFMQ